MDENTTALSPEEKKRTVRLIDGQDYDPWECRGRAPSAETAAFGLARLNRYGGHTTRPYSVAEHSIWMALYIVCGGTDNPLFQESAAWFAGGTDPNEALRGLCMSRIFEATSILVRESDPLVLEVRFDGKKQQCTTLSYLNWKTACYALVHDAPEGCGLVDLPSPVGGRPELREYRLAHDRCLAWLCEEWKLEPPSQWWERVHPVDTAILGAERVLRVGLPTTPSMMLPTWPMFALDREHDLSRHGDGYIRQLWLSLYRHFRRGM